MKLKVYYIHADYLIDHLLFKTDQVNKWSQDKDNYSLLRV